MKSKLYPKFAGPRKRSLPTAALFIALAVLVVSIASSFYSRKQAVASAARADMPPAVELMKVVIPDETPEILCPYTGFTVSFNPSWHVPNYVAWELLRSELEGSSSRSSHRFAPDNEVYGCSSLADYRNSGFDRGHMAPAADMKWSEESMRDCHLLTNIVPQDHSLNSGIWNSLEMKSRNYADRDSAVIIICGPVLSDRITRTIGRGVAVPERFFKVILAPYANPPRAIAWVLPNRSVRESLGSMAMTVDQVEEITGFDFFSALPDSLEQQVESTLHIRDWNIR